MSEALTAYKSSIKYRLWPLLDLEFLNPRLSMKNKSEVNFLINQGILLRWRDFRIHFFKIKKLFSL